MKANKIHGKTYFNWGLFQDNWEEMSDIDLNGKNSESEAENAISIDSDSDDDWGWMNAEVVTITVNYDPLHNEYLTRDVLYRSYCCIVSMLIHGLQQMWRMVP